MEFADWTAPKVPFRLGTVSTKSCPKSAVKDTSLAALVEGRRTQRFQAAKGRVEDIVNGAPRLTKEHFEFLAAILQDAARGAE